jgi:hypothetical protein
MELQPADNAQPIVQPVFELITHRLGEHFAFHDLTQLIEAGRAKPLRIEERPLYLAGTTGYCFPLQDVDVIVVRAGLDPPRSLMVRLHECSHFLLRHIPRSSTISYREYCDRPELLLKVYRIQRAMYDEPKEQAAETLGTLLAERILQHDAQQHEKSTPALIVELFGSEE